MGINQSSAIECFLLLGDEIKKFLTNPENPEWKACRNAIAEAEIENSWFNRENIITGLENYTTWLRKDTLDKWLSPYKSPHYSSQTKNREPIGVGVVMAGNIPMAGFHDLMCVMVSGNILYAKLSGSDRVLMKYINERLTYNCPEIKERINVVEHLPSGLNAVIATGSDNSARHFEYYFRKIPHIIRRNRNGVAIITGEETGEELKLLGKDIFTYFGLGCRSVSKIYVPQGYDMQKLTINLENYRYVINHNKYANNYLTNRVKFLMDGRQFIDTGFLILIRESAISSPIGVVHFEEFDTISNLVQHLNTLKNKIQCVALTENLINNERLKYLPCVAFGQTQHPRVNDYADDVDVMNFLQQ